MTGPGGRERRPGPPRWLSAVRDPGRAGPGTAGAVTASEVMVPGGVIAADDDDAAVDPDDVDVRTRTGR